MPFLVVDAGSLVKPEVPYVSFDMKPGNDIRTGNAVDESYVKKGLEYGELLAGNLPNLVKWLLSGKASQEELLLLSVYCCTRDRCLV